MSIPNFHVLSLVAHSIPRMKREWVKEYCGQWLDVQCGQVELQRINRMDPPEDHCPHR